MALSRNHLRAETERLARFEYLTTRVGDSLC